MGETNLQKIKRMIKNENISLDDIKNLFVDKSEILFNDELVELFVLDKVGIAKSSLIAYKSIINSFRRFIKDENLQLVNELQVRNFLDYVNEKDIALETKKNYLRILKVFYNHFLSDGVYLKQKSLEKYGKMLIIDKNPCPKKYRFIGYKALSDDILEKDEIEKYLKLLYKIFNFRHYLMFKLILNSSCRIGGICKIKIEDIDWNLRQFKVEDKGKERIYCFDKNMKQDLLIYLKLRNQNEKALESEYFFVSKNFTKLSYVSILIIYWKRLNEIKREMGKIIRTTNLRKTFRTLRMLEGQDSIVVEALMGRKSKSLEHIYMKLKGKALTKAFDEYNFLIDIK